MEVKKEKRRCGGLQPPCFTVTPSLGVASAGFNVDIHVQWFMSEKINSRAMQVIHRLYIA